MPSECCWRVSSLWAWGSPFCSASSAHWPRNWSQRDPDHQHHRRFFDYGVCGVTQVGAFERPLGAQASHAHWAIRIQCGHRAFNSVLLAGLEGIIKGTGLFLLLIVARITHAAVMSATMPASTAYMADITTAANRTKGMGAAGAANNLGSIMGPALTIFAFISLLFPLWLMAGLAFINGMLVWRFLPEAPKVGNGSSAGAVKVRYSDERIRPFVIVGVLMLPALPWSSRPWDLGFKMPYPCLPSRRPECLASP